MGPLDALGVFLGICLFFFVPGFAVARAVFPERRLRGAGGARGAVELLVLAFVLSVVLTVLVGYLLLTFAPGGFSAGWSSPALESALGAIAAVAFAVGALEGSYAPRPAPMAATPPEPGSEGAWELSRALDRIGTARRAAGRRGNDAETRERERALDDEERALRSAREAEYDR